MTLIMIAKVMIIGTRILDWYNCQSQNYKGTIPFNFTVFNRLWVKISENSIWTAHRLADDLVVFGTSKSVGNAPYSYKVDIKDLIFPQ